MDDIVRRYLELALSLERHVEGFVDAYFGPPEIKAAVDAAPPRPLGELEEETARLLADVRSGGLPPGRQAAVRSTSPAGKRISPIFFPST